MMKIIQRTYNKVALLILIILLLFTISACQETPDELVVQNKGDGRLQEAIMQTAQPQDNESIEGTEKTDAELESIYETIELTRTNNLGNVTVNVNCSVKLQGDEKVTVANIEKYNFTKEDVDNIMSAFFGEDIIYLDSHTKSKASVEALILEKKQLMNNEEALLQLDYAIINGITDIEVLREHEQKIIDDLILELEELSDERPEIMLNYDIFSALVEFGKDYQGGAFIYNEKDTYRPILLGCTAFGGKYSTSNIEFFSTFPEQVDENLADVQLNKAKGAAQSMIDSMKISGVKMGDIYIAPNIPVAAPSDNPIDDKEYYVICFERVVGERTLDYTLHLGDGPSTGFDRPWRHEKIHVWVDGDKVCGFTWYCPAVVTEIINENVAVQIDYQKAIDLAINQLFIQYTYIFDNEMSDSINIDITKMDFELVRTKEMNTNSYITVPAWNIHGILSYALTDEHMEQYDISDRYRVEPEKNLVTVNALDGTIIDLSSGY